MAQKLRNFVPKFTNNKIFEIDYKILGFVGFVPEKILSVRPLLIFILSLLLVIFPEIWFIIKNSDDVQAVFMCLHEFVSLLVYILEVFVFFFKRQTLLELIKDLKEEWKKSFEGGNEDWNHTGRHLEKLVFTTTRNFYGLVIFTTIVYFFLPIFVYFTFVDRGENPQWPLPVQVYYGFNFPDHPVIYVLFLVIVIPNVYCVAFILYGIDVFFINILIFCASYFKFVQCEFERLKKDLENGLEDDKDIRERVKKIVISHYKGIEFSEKLEEVLNLLMLVLYSVNTLVLCFLFFEFQILLSDAINFLKVLFFFGVVQTLLVLFSYFGTKLMDESQLVGYAAYDLPWYKINDCKTRKYLILTMARSQKPICISSGKFYPVNLESYFDAIKTAYSSCTVMQKVM